MKHIGALNVVFFHEQRNLGLNPPECMFSLWVLRLHPTAQRHARAYVNW